MGFISSEIFNYHFSIAKKRFDDAVKTGKYEYYWEKVVEMLKRDFEGKDFIGLKL